MKQAGLVVSNIQHLLRQEPLEEYDATDPPAIHLTLGIVSIFPFTRGRPCCENTRSHIDCTQSKSVVFRNPLPGSNEVWTKDKDDG